MSKIPQHRALHATLLRRAKLFDSRAAVDLNCVMNGNGNLIEVQGTGEGRPFTLEEEQKLLRLCGKGCRELIALEKKVLGELV